MKTTIEQQQIAARWWRGLQPQIDGQPNPRADRAALARLRRADLLAAMQEPATFVLFRQLGRHRPEHLPEVALCAVVLAGVRGVRPEHPARTLGPPSIDAVEQAEKRGERGQRHDVVMHMLKQAPSGDRAASRAEAIREAGAAWLMRKALATGFALDLEQLHIDRYEHLRIPRDGPGAITLSTLTFEGLLTEPARFVAAILSGFGSAKAYGCGLMLIRRPAT
ncbi:MAG TPA: type I-E CRISPR-associated protein Cas6/Cse3/CasE [Stellaceae bacterium]|jgi:hypothetical protein